jgi:uncharacterized protein Yka (UPF0111/DUF47 family)
VCYCRIIEAADDAADALEEATFQLTLPADGPALPDLRQLGDLLVAACDAYGRAAAAARTIGAPGATEATRTFLEAVDQVLALERETDEQQRRISHALVSARLDVPLLFVITGVANRLEQAADALMHASLLMRTAVVGAVMTAQ